MSENTAAVVTRSAGHGVALGREKATIARQLRAGSWELVKKLITRTPYGTPAAREAWLAAKTWLVSIRGAARTWGEWAANAQASLAGKQHTAVIAAAPASDRPLVEIGATVQRLLLNRGRIFQQPAMATNEQV